jgi:tetratricopeptide (TPR) repeat protein
VEQRELARKLVQRGVLTEAQLREAESYARGGRSIFAVLLDLGHCRPEDLAAVLPPPPPPRSSKWTIAFALALVCVFSYSAGTVMSPPPSRAVHRFHAVPTEVPLAERLAERALQILRRAEAPGSAIQHADLERAVALLEEALTERPGDPDLLYAASRCRELVGRDEIALQGYCKILSALPSHGRALAGASRCSLALGDRAAAWDYADRAVRTSPGPEALLARARAYLLNGEDAKARADLLEARQRDRTYAAVIDPLLRRLEAGR